ncbi:hypothetical protein [Nitrobacter vulgaris]|uniref:Uncharacterized protein n=1 Tax=Nitrobacter vulgaris TaxID=29421 RepID=A0A1V4HVU6_NITVU|nr:hypothetical protein [Nitrobacter vulgaris]OPH82096.1 hypothetical protein B2M20_12980 [Nitrobacter vulgaris]
MPKPIVKSSQFRSDLDRFLGDAPLVGDERQEDYDAFYENIVSSMSQPDVINKLYLKDFVDLSWQIRRERLILADIIRLFQKEVVLDLLKTAYKKLSGPIESLTTVDRFLGADREAQRWLGDPAARKEIDADLLARGYSPSTVLALAYRKGAAEIDMVEQRIASYEIRRLMALREIERRNELAARQLKKSTTRLIEGELGAFKEAAE